MTPTSRQRLPIVRVILCVIGLILCVVFTVDWARSSRGLEAARTARMGETHVDLSKPGQIRVPARFDFGAAHGLSLMLTGASEASLKELGAKVAIATGDEKQLEWRDIDPEWCRRIGDEVELYRTMGAPREFAFVLDIQRPVLAPVGQEQRLYARYELCGLENLAVTISGFFAIGAGVLSAGVLGSVVYSIRKHKAGAKQADSPQGA